MTIKIYHNPRCSKSRQTLQLLRDNGVEPEVIEYLKTPLNEAELKRILEMMDMGPREIIRKKEAEYKEQGLDDPSLNNDKIIAKMAAFPKLIERPIVMTSSGKCALGRPPEAVLEII